MTVVFLQQGLISPHRDNKSIDNAALDLPEHGSSAEQTGGMFRGPGGVGQRRRGALGVRTPVGVRWAGEGAEPRWAEPRQPRH